MTARATLLATAVTIAAGTMLVAQSTTPGLPTGTGSVSGRIVDADTGVPVPGATVRAAQIGAGTMKGAVSAMSDAGGRYVLQGLVPGRVSVSVSGRAAYLNVSLVASKAVDVPAGREVSNLDFRVRLEAQVSGRVTDLAGTPLPGIRVFAVRREYSRSDYGLEVSSAHLWHFVVGSAMTDDRGRYTFERLHAGRSHWLFAHAPVPHGRPVSDAPADPASRAPVLVTTYYGGADRLDAALPIVLRSFEHREGADIEMRRLPQFCASAQLTKAGVPAPLDFRVEIEDVHRLQFLNTPNPSWRPTGRAGADGRVRVCGLHDGRYRLTALETITSRGIETTSHANVGFDLDGADAVLDTVAAQPPVTIAGDVRWARQPREPAAFPTFNLRASPSVTWPASPSGVTAPPAEFSLRAFANEPHNLVMSDLRHPLYVDDVTFDGQSILGGVLVPGTGGDGRLTIAVGADAATMQIEVRDRSGRPAGGIGVLVLAEGESTEAELASSIRAAVVTGDAGAVVAEGLPPGRYRVIATEDLPPYVVNLPSETLRIERSPEAMAVLLRARARGRVVNVGPDARVTVTLEPVSLD